MQMSATSSGLAKRRSKADGRFSAGNGASLSNGVTPRSAASPAIIAAAPWVRIGPGRMVPTVTPVPANTLNGEALPAAAVRGRGIIYPPQFIVAEAAARGELVVLPLDKPPVELGGVHVLDPPDRRPPAKVRAMIGHLAEVFAQAPPAAGKFG